MRACDAWKEGPRVPRSAVASAVERDGYRGPTREKIKCTPATERRAKIKKAGKNYFGGSEGAGGKKVIFWAGAKKNSGVNENTTHKKKSFRRERKIILASTRTQPTKRVTYSRDVFFFYLFLSGVSTGRSCNH